MLQLHHMSLVDELNFSSILTRVQVFLKHVQLLINNQIKLVKNN